MCMLYLSISNISWTETSLGDDDGSSDSVIWKWLMRMTNMCLCTNDPKSWVLIEGKVSKDTVQSSFGEGRRK